MSYPAQPSPQRDLVEEFSTLIHRNKDTHSEDSAISALAQSLIEAISDPAMPPANLIARIEVMILDKIDVDSDQESLLSKIAELRTVVSLKKDTIDQLTLHKEMIKAKVENYLKYPMVPIDKDSLFNSAKQLYFTGHLKDKNDLFVIHYLIKESSPVNTAIEPSNFRLSFILKSAKWINYFKKVFSATDGGPVFNDGNVAQIRELAIYIENLDIRS